MAAQDLIGSAEILIDEPMAARGRRMLEALAACAPTGSFITSRYEGRHELLVTYGVGLPQRLAARAAHLSCGGHVAMWDLGYWDRDEAMRLSIDSLHPTAAQLELAPSGTRKQIAIREDANPQGSILLVGMGQKSARMLGYEPLEWERKKLRELRKKFPMSRVIWRPKGRRPTNMPGCTSAHGLPIETALMGCSMVVCRHSNVGVDACIAGIPVDCQDGAARALYETTSAPSAAERTEFLRRLSWWNWFPSEAPQAWNWILRVTQCA